MKRTFIFLISIAALISILWGQQVESKDTIPLFPIKLNGKWGYIDKTGKIIIKPQFDEADKFFEGLARVKTGSKPDTTPPIRGKWGFIDKTGKYVIKPTFDTVQQFSEGRAAVRIFAILDDGVGYPQWGYIDKTGIPLTPTIRFYDDARPFHEGLALVKINFKWGYINKKGKTVIEPQFDQADDFSHGLAKVMIGDKICYIDKTGKYVWKPTK